MQEQDKRMNHSSPAQHAERQRTVLVCFLLAMATGALYWPIHAFDFINLDDPFMIYENPMVTGGLTWRGILWGLGTSYYDQWHPMAWWSRMLDCELFGLHAGWHHLTGLAFHIANTVILFLALRQMTGKPGRSAVVAALFALHPMRVEPVVWLGTREHVLSTFFWLLSLWAYASYVKKLRSRSPKGELFYHLSLFLFFCGLMSKPMVTTLPFVLLLLDYWPLNRYENGLGGLPSAGGDSEQTTPYDPKGAFLKLVKEKIPYFVLAGISCFITFSNMKSGNNLISTDKLSWSIRLANVPVSYVRYLGKLIWPVNLSVFYPMPAHWPAWQVIGSVVVLLLISLVAAARFRKAPYLAVGWCIFLGTLVPTLSLVPFAWQSIADRYTYLPYIGLLVAVVWGATDVLNRFKPGVAAPASLAFLALLGCMCVTRVQLGYWRDSFTLWPHCISVTKDNFMAHYNLGYLQQNFGQLTNAMENYQAALKIRPDDWQANMNMGRVLAATGRMSDSTNYFIKAIQSRPDSPLPHRNLGMALTELHVDLPRAVAELNESVRLDPADLKTRVTLGKALAAQGSSIEAIACFSEILRAAPASPEVMYYLAKEQLKQGQIEDAIANLNRALQMDPSLTDARVQIDTAMKMRGGNQPGKSLSNLAPGPH
jgi:Flp pilus assembly protein TadD